MEMWYNELIDEIVLVKETLNDRLDTFIPITEGSVEIVDEIFYHLLNMLEDLRDDPVSDEKLRNRKSFLKNSYQYITNSVVNICKAPLELVKEILENITEAVWKEIFGYNFTKTKYRVYLETVCPHSYIDTYEVEADSEEEASMKVFEGEGTCVAYDNAGDESDEPTHQNILNINYEIINHKSC